jgi:hypothetical protein
MKAYTVVEPTNQKPRLLRFADNVSDSGVVEGR